MIWQNKKAPIQATGTIGVDNRTKRLIGRLLPGQIAVIDHEDIDEVAAMGLVAAKVKAVINASSSISGTYPAPGTEKLVENGIIVIDQIGKEWFERLQDGMTASISDHIVSIVDHNTEDIFSIETGTRLGKDEVNKLMEHARENMEEALQHFIDNTLIYAQKEKAFVLKSLFVSDLRTRMENRHVVVVVRGANYKEDLAAIRSYIDDVKPVLIGVDGGADALLEHGLKPDMIVGDMDSISDEALKCGAEIVVHAYIDGNAPGLERVHNLGLKGIAVPMIGTSEDVAMLMAYDHRAQIIVALGTHSHMVDFLEKGRKGMGSTLLVRMKIGTKLVDAKGVSQLYMQRKVNWQAFVMIGLAAFFPIIAISFINPNMKRLLELFWLNIKMLLM